MKIIRIITFVLFIIASIIFSKSFDGELTQKNDDFPKIQKETNIIKGTPEVHKRWADQTYLTFPEWFLVHAPQEQADYFTHSTSTTFPYTNHIQQLWSSYNTIYWTIKDTYEFNTWYHVMIMVIWVSSTLEYWGKAMYENVIGRVTNTSTNEEMTQEDIFYARFSNDYVDFINHTPWYEFDFQSRFTSLWSDTSFFWKHFLRKIERKYFISSELLVKSVYAKLIRMGTKASFETPLLETAVVIDSVPDDLEGTLPKIRQLESREDSYLVTLPRYQEFTSYAIALAQLGVEFKEIAGNSGDILLSVLLKDSDQLPSSSTILFSQTISTKPGIKRLAITTKVPLLSNLLRELNSEQITLEHIYDY